MCDNKNCSGQPFEVSAAKLLTFAESANDAVAVQLAAQAITRWTGCQACRNAFASLLAQSRELLCDLLEEAERTWTELD